ncbi:hypothetical protein WJR50_20655 [Catalinimonas sp. 4WD22]|uniref:hypothetical protein n=1 Tax=Catalinimonas locisalis TaxID=3133978 RepID=UPI00310111E1
MCLLKIQAQHLWLNHELVKQYFRETEQVIVAFVASGPHLLIAPAPATVLIKVHPKASSRLFKLKNLKGDRTISLHDFFIDYNLADSDKPLDYNFVEKLDAIKVTL